jgi:hypothetical protein
MEEELPAREKVQQKEKANGQRMENEDLARIAKEEKERAQRETTPRKGKRRPLQRPRARQG